MRKTLVMEPHQMMHVPTIWTECVVHLPGGRRIITCSLDGILRLWDMESGTQIGDGWQDSENRGGKCSMALSPNGRTVANGNFGGKVRLWDVETGKVIARWTGHAEAVSSVCWSLDGERVVSGSWDGTVTVWDVGSGKLALGPFKTGHQRVYAVIYSPITSKIATCGYTEGIKIWDANTGELFSTIEFDSPVDNLAWTSDQKKLVFVSYNLIRIFDTTISQEIAVLKGHYYQQIKSLALFQNDRLLASASKDKTARLWNLDTNLPVGPPIRHESPLDTAAISADGKLLVTTCDSRICVWVIETTLKDAGLEDLLSIPNNVVDGKTSAVETSQQETHTSLLHPTSTPDPCTSSNTTSSIPYPTCIAR